MAEVLRVPQSACVGCGTPLPVSATTQVDSGKGVVTMCGRCRYWQGGRCCHPDPAYPDLPSDVRDTVSEVLHRPDCPLSESFDARKTRTNLSACPLLAVGVEEESK